MVNSTQDQILAVLMKQFPLTLMQISKLVRKEKNVTYQGVRKAVNELVKEDMVENVDKLYFLNKSWVAKQAQLFSRAYTTYFNIGYNPNQIDTQSKIQVFRFSTLQDILTFILESYLKGYLQDNSSGDIYISVRRLPPMIPSSVIQLVKKLQEKNTLYIMCKSDRLADRWAAKFYRSLGIKVKTNVDIPHQNILCFDNFMLQLFCFYPQEHAEKIYSFEEKFEKKSRLSLLKIIDEAFHKKAEIYVVMNRYPVFLQDIKKLVKDVWG